ncbi:MAG: 50S ribosomal protein L19 [Patescibacteria group bacterium]|nr:MAG: 50S ribosomal protein L19 [Patescibacteria group bacterium]
MAQYLEYKDQTIAVGDTVRVHQEITEGDKTRIQIFEGLVIAVKNRDNGKSFTVRKVGAGGVGVEKIYPINMPQIKDIEVRRKGSVRKSKLYFLRERLGKSATRIKEKDTNSTTKKAE